MRRSAAELASTPEPGWPLVQGLISKSKLNIEVLPAERARADAELEALQVTTRSFLGALAHNCGGLLVDHGWLKILGCGCERFSFSITSLTRALGWADDDRPPQAVAVGLDVLGDFSPSTAARSLRRRMARSITSTRARWSGSTWLGGTAIGSRACSSARGSRSSTTTCAGRDGRPRFIVSFQGRGSASIRRFGQPSLGRSKGRAENRSASPN